MFVTRRTLTTLLALAATIAAATMPVSAQSRSIYGGGVDDDAALVRLVNAGASGPAEFTLGAASLKAPAPGDATPYRQAVADIYVLSYLGRRYEFLPEPGSYYTIAATADGLAILDDVKHVDPSKAQVYFYNLHPGQAELKTQNGSTPVAGPCPSGSSAQAAVNPVRVSLAAFSGGTRLGEPVQLRMERGGSYSVFVYGEPPSAATFYVKAAVE